MNKVHLFLLVMSVVIFSACSCKTAGKISINKGWKFKLIDESKDRDEQYTSNNFNDAQWESVSLPHTAHLEPLVVNEQWQGICWYRKTIDLSNFDSDQKVLIELEGAMNHSKMWVNGDMVAVHQGGYLPVVVDITKYVSFDEPNVIAVRLNNKDNPITGPKPLKRLDFCMYGGLYRNAWLIIKDKVHISHPSIAKKVAGGGVFIRTPKVSEKESIVKAKTHVVNESDDSKPVELLQKIYFGTTLVRQTKKNTTIEAGESTELKTNFRISDAQLWSPSSPNLYTLETSIKVDGEIVDKDSTRFGIREFRFEGNELFVNGKKTYLRGVNRHQEYPYIGYALSDNAQYRDAKKIKESGFDYIRLSHYPQSPAFMDACDELGLIVIDAILGWQFYLESEDFKEYCYRSAHELIRRDRNHPCVLAWEVSLNETKMPVPFMAELDKIVHEEYPSETTYSCGWMNDVYDLFFQSRQHRIMHHYDSIQTKPYMVSEYGDWEYHSKNPGLNQHKFNDILRAEKSSRQLRGEGEERLLQQAYNFAESHSDNMNTAAYGDAYWVMYDYNRGYHDNIESSGVMDIFRLPKFGYYFYKSQQDPTVENVLQIASYWDKNSTRDVRIFGNCEEVKLYLNGKLVAIQSADRTKETKNLSYPPFTFSLDEFVPGTLRAEGICNGKVVSESIVRTPEKASELKVWVDESGKAPEKGVNDVVFAHVAVVDANGTVLPDFTGKIHLNTGGDVVVLNSSDVTVEAGIASVVLKIGDNASSITIEVSCENLPRKQFQFKVN